jgi:hypothetical protein
LTKDAGVFVVLSAIVPACGSGAANCQERKNFAKRSESGKTSGKAQREVEVIGMLPPSYS